MLPLVPSTQSIIHLSFHYTHSYIYLKSSTAHIVITRKLDTNWLVITSAGTACRRIDGKQLLLPNEPTPNINAHSLLVPVLIMYQLISLLVRFSQTPMQTYTLFLPYPSHKLLYQHTSLFTIVSFSLNDLNTVLFSVTFLCLLLWWFRSSVRSFSLLLFSGFLEISMSLVLVGGVPYRSPLAWQWESVHCRTCK